MVEKQLTASQQCTVRRQKEQKQGERDGRGRKITGTLGESTRQYLSASHHSNQVALASRLQLLLSSSHETTALGRSVRRLGAGPRAAERAEPACHDA